MTTLTLGYRDTPLHAAVAAAVARVLEAHDVEPEFVSGSDDVLAAMLKSGEIDLFATAWLPDETAAFVSPAVEPRGDLYKPAFACCITDTDAVAGVQSLTDLAASTVGRNVIAAASLVGRVRQMIAGYSLTEAGFTIESLPDEEAFQALGAAIEAGESVIVPLFTPNFLFHRHTLRPLNDPRGIVGVELTARLLFRKDLLGELDGDLLDELDELPLGNKVVSALDDAVRHADMSAEDAAEAWQRGKLLPR